MSITIFLDLDGCVFKKEGDGLNQIHSDRPLLPGVREKFINWDGLGYQIILTTARKESSRPTTEENLRRMGLVWDQLIMGITNGKRVLINDLKPNSSEPTAVAINLKRNEGMESMSIEDATISG